MKNSTKIFSLAALIVIAGWSAGRAADDTTPPPPPPAKHEGGPRMNMKKMREHRMKILEEKVHVTAEQKTQILAIWDKAEEQTKALRADKSVAREDRRAKMGEIMKTSHDQVRALLTPEQQTIFDTLPPEGPRGGPPRDGDRPPEPPPGEAKSE